MTHVKDARTISLDTRVLILSILRTAHVLYEPGESVLWLSESLILQTACLKAETKFANRYCSAKKSLLLRTRQNCPSSSFLISVWQIEIVSFNLFLLMLPERYLLLKTWEIVLIHLFLFLVSRSNRILFLKSYSGLTGGKHGWQPRSWNNLIYNQLSLHSYKEIEKHNKQNPLKNQTPQK